MNKHKPKNKSKDFARRCLSSYLAGGCFGSVSANNFLDTLEIPNNLTFKERLSYFQLIEMDKNEN